MFTKISQLLLLSLLLATLVVHKRTVARRSLVNRAANELAIEGDRLRSEIESGVLTRPREIQAAFERIRRESSLSIAWIQLRDQNGAVAARVGEHPAGAVVVHTVAIQWTSATALSQWKLATHRTQDHVAVIEIAARLDHVNPGALARTTKPTLEEKNTL